MSSGKGIIFALPPSNKRGDFALDPYYAWTTTQLSSWTANQTIPTHLTSVPDKSAKLFTLIYVTPLTRRLPDNDIRITPSIYRRLEEDAPTATVVLVPFSPEQVLLFPRAVIGFTESMRKGYRDGSIDDGNAPTFGECVKPEYAPGGGAPVLGSSIHLSTVEELVQSLGGRFVVVLCVSTALVVRRCGLVPL